MLKRFQCSVVQTASLMIFILKRKYLQVDIRSKSLYWNWIVDKLVDIRNTGKSVA